MKKRGFSLMETMVVMVFLVGALIIIGYGALGVGVIKGNGWWTKDTVLTAIKESAPNKEFTRIRTSETKRRFFRRSIIAVEQKDGTVTKCLLDTNILWEYDLECDSSGTSEDRSGIDSGG